MREDDDDGVTPGLRILAVDDDAWLLRAYRRLITRPHEVVPALSGAEARARIAEDPCFDLVLCDLQMPDESGVELYRSLAEEWPELAERFVFVTAESPTELATVAGEGVRSITKPFKADALVALLSGVKPR